MEIRKISFVILFFVSAINAGLYAFFVEYAELWALLMSQIMLAGVIPFLIILNYGKRRLFGAFTIILALMVWTMLIVLFHAIIYHRTGLLMGDDLNDVLPFSDALYFSIVTFTTLGYGDFSPNPDYRLAAALEAVYGLIYIGLLIGLVVSGFQNAGDEHSDKPNS